MQTDADVGRPRRGRQIAPALLPEAGRSEVAGTALSGICSVQTTTWETGRHGRDHGKLECDTVWC
jgi:hypothetical protein